MAPVNLDMTLIERPKVHMRSTIKKEDVESLIESIEEIGLLNPITVKQEGDKYRIIIGERRFYACIYLEWTFIPCYIIDINDEKQVQYMTHENYFREDVSIIDESQFFTEVINNNSWTQKQLSDLIGKSESYVSERIAIMNYPVCLFTALLNKSITFSVARELSKVKNESIIEMLTQQAVDNGCTPVLAKKWREQYNVMEEQLDAMPDNIEYETIIEKDFDRTIKECDFCGTEVTNIAEFQYFKACPKCTKQLTEPLPIEPTE